MHYEDLHSSIIVKAMNAATWEWNIQTGELIINDRWAEIIGYTLEELKPVSIETWIRFAHPADLEKSDKGLRDVFNKEVEYYECEVRMLHKDGRSVWVRDSGKVIIWNEKNEPLIMIGTHVDITDKMETRLALEHSENNFRQITQNAKDIIYRLDLDGNMTYLSNAWTQLLGFSVEEGLNKPFRMFVHEEDLHAMDMYFEHVKKNQGTEEFYDYRLVQSNGQYRHFETSPSAIIESDKVIGYVGIARDITEIIKKQEQVNYLVYHDQLTTFGNRHYLSKLELEILHPSHFPLCVISIDLNNLKQVNDTFGHLVGDQMIEVAAQIVKQNVKNTKYLFRMGGDEFLAFIPNMDDSEKEELLVSLAHDIAKHQNETFPLSLAIGAHIKTIPDANLHDAIRSADHQMYLNKHTFKIKM